jgi:LmbE family N-acetylglucosaminyl deacetylase
LAVPAHNIHFLDLPDGRLKRYADTLRKSLKTLMQAIQPDHVLMPFRYDRHPDHLAVNRETRKALQHCGYHADLIEYFVYYRWQLLPGKDVRRYIDRNHLMAIAIKDHIDQKRQALACYKSQTTRFYTWQDRPVLSQASIDEVCLNPEIFLRYNALFPDATVFTRARTWIRIIHVLEPALKKRKDRVRALISRGLAYNRRKTA